MRFTTGQKRRLPTINIINMVDIMVVLLISLFIMARFDIITDSGIKVDLPAGKTRELPQAPVYLNVAITADGSVFIRGQKAQASELKEKLTEACKSLTDPILVIMADKAAPAGLVIATTDAAKSIGQRKLFFKVKE